MAHSSGSKRPDGPNIYDALLADEEAKFQKRGGERRLISKHGAEPEVVISKVPSARLKHLRASEPAVGAAEAGPRQS